MEPGIDGGGGAVEGGMDEIPKVPPRLIVVVPAKVR
jgi:hypothetical protein